MGTKRVIINFTEKELDDYVNRRIFMPDLAKNHKANKETIRQRLRELNRDDINKITALNRCQSNVKMTDEPFSKILCDYNSGVKISDISLRHGVTSVTINTHLRNRGVPIRKKIERETKQERIAPRIVLSVKLPKTIFTQIHRQFTKSMMQAYA